MRQRHRAAAELTLDQGEVEMAQPRAADGLGEVAGVEARGQGLAPDRLRQIGRDAALTLDLRLVREDLALDEGAHGGDDHLLLVGEAEVHAPPP